MCFFVLTLISINGYAQKTSSYTEIQTDTIIEGALFIPMFDLRRSFGIYPEIQFINSPVIGVSASLARLKDVEWSSFNRGVNLGFEFDPVQEFYGPKMTVWGDIFALFTGGNVGLSMMYYRQVNRGGLYLRPEIGIGIPRLHLKYGFGFRMVGDQIAGFQRHTLTLGYHFSLIKRSIMK